MQAFQYWKTAMPVLTSRITQNVQPQIRTISRSLSSGQQILSSRTYSSFNSSIFSSVSKTRPALSKFNTNTYIPSPPVFNQIRAFSASASLAGKRATYNPSRRVQKRRHGFLARLRTRTGRMILKRRRLKGRKDLSW